MATSTIIASCNGLDQLEAAVKAAHEVSIASLPPSTSAPPRPCKVRQVPQGFLDALVVLRNDASTIDECEVAVKAIGSLAEHGRLSKGEVAEATPLIAEFVASGDAATGLVEVIVKRALRKGSPQAKTSVKAS